MFDRNEFRASVIRAGLTLEKLATDIGINPATLSRKMSGESDFTRAEIHHIRMALNLTPAEADKIFFADKLA